MPSSYLIQGFLTGTAKVKTADAFLDGSQKASTQGLPAELHRLRRERSCNKATGKSEGVTASEEGSEVGVITLLAPHRCTSAPDLQSADLPSGDDVDTNTELESITG